LAYGIVKEKDMKVRLKFVSNSSSSSFICEVCGRDESGWDMGHEDADMVTCVNGHLICKSHILCSSEEFQELYDENDDIYYDFPEKYCPVCQGKSASRYDIIAFAKKKGLVEEMMALIEDKGYERFRRDYL
jgi:hypothetical protein